MCYAPPPRLSEREREMEPALRSLAGLDSRAAAAAAAINTITAFSGRFSGPVFFWGVISLSSFLALNRHVSKQMYTFTPMSNTYGYTTIHTWIYEYISMNIACIYYGIFTQLCQTTLAFTNNKRTAIISLYLKDDKLLFGVLGTFLLLCSLEIFWLAIHHVHYNSEASLTIFLVIKTWFQKDSPLI